MGRKAMIGRDENIQKKVFYMLLLNSLMKGLRFTIPVEEA